MVNHKILPWPQRFWDKTEPGEDACINWNGATSAAGYGVIWVTEKQKICLSHRVAFTLAHGREPRMEIDHVCRNMRCVNHEHLREATPHENMMNSSWAFKSECPKGHPYDKANTIMHRGQRFCRACRDNWNRVGRHLRGYVRRRT